MQKQATRSRKAQSAHKHTSLPLSDFNRIKASVADQGRTTTLEEDRRRLKETCDSRTKNWSNTILALRKKKVQDKYEKFEREELERRKVDQDEAEYQAGVKQTVMNQAKRQLFERNDKVKTLHSKMLLSDVLQERDLQKEIENHKKAVKEDIEREHYEEILRQCGEYDEKEEQKTKEHKAKREHQQEVLKQQHEAFRDKHIVKLMEGRIEGEIIKQKAKEQEIQAMHDERERRNKIKRAQAETHKGNLQLQEIRRKEREKELLEEDKIKLYLKEKEEKERKRKEDQDKKFEEKQRIRQMMIDKAVSDLQKKNNKENERLKKDIQEARIKAENVEKEKREKIQKLKGTIDHHRELYMRDKAIKKDKEYTEDKAFQMFWKDKNKAIVNTSLPFRKTISKKKKLTELP